ncbi:hypothetical protein Tco_0727224 [Tanacetum coccineum]|uniref:Uncharacterized protein n=1 Tax=Tanacetum coccineum TaxID=301880 RepID=A0ABQ4YKT9_9ASTR
MTSATQTSCAKLKNSLSYGPCYKEIDDMTSEPIPNVPNEAVYEEWDDKVERATTTASLDAKQACGNINKTQSTAMPNVHLPQEIGTGGSPRCQKAMGGSIAQTRSERKVESLEVDLKQTKQVYGAAYTKLIMKVKKLEKIVKTSQARKRAKFVVFDDEEEDPSKQGRTKVLADAAKENVHTYTRRRRVVSTGSGGISTASRLFSIAKESVSTAVKDKGKGKMEEYDNEQTKRTKLQQEQERLGHEAAMRLQEELDEEERQRMARRLQAEEKNKYSEVDQAKMLVDLVNQRKRYFVAQKAEAKRNKPMTQAQQRNYMVNYIKHMGSHTLRQLKIYSFDKLKELFETTMKNVNAFIPMETEDRGRASELAARSSQATVTDSTKVGSSKRAAKVELNHKGSKKQKTNEASGSVKEQPDKEEKELS